MFLERAFCFSKKAPLFDKKKHYAKPRGQMEVESPLRSNGLVVKVLDSQSRGPCSQLMGGYKVDSAFHPSEVKKMRTRNFWELGGKN